MARRIAVELNQWKRGERGDILEVSDVQSTIVVALSDAQTGNGYLGHFSPDATTLEEMLKAAKDQATHPLYVNLWYGGAAFSFRQRNRMMTSSNTETRQFRIRTSRLLATQGFYTRASIWLDPGQRLAARLIAGAEHCILTVEA